MRRHFNLACIVLLALFASNTIYAQNKRTIHVATAGTLPELISVDEKYQIEELTITGELNGTDFRLLRDMAGRSIEANTTNGKLKVLDLSGVKIVSGGQRYVDVGNVKFSVERDDVMPEYVFNKCSLTNLILPNTITAIGSEALEDCISLTSIDIPSGVVNLGSECFKGCISLSSIIIPEGVTNIGKRDFNGCTSLKTLTIPSTVVTFGTDILLGCNLCSLIWNVKGNDQNLEELVKQASMTINTNSLLYLNSSSVPPKDMKNIVINGEASSITLSDDGDSFFCPIAFTAKKISYTHHFGMETGGNGKGWETIVLPFNVQKISHSTRGEIIPFASYNGGANQKPFWLASMMSGGFRSSSKIEANTPYIIAMPNSNKYQNEYNLAGDLTFSAENVSIPATPTFSGTFMPTYSTVTKSSNVLALNVVNKYVSNSGGYDAGSRFISNLRDVRPFEVYISQGSSTRGVIEIGFGDGTTGMGEVIGVYDADKVIDIHTLNGQKITKAKQGELDKVIDQLPHGVYIVNGKKIAK